MGFDVDCQSMTAATIYLTQIHLYIFNKMSSLAFNQPGPHVHNVVNQRGVIVES